jgi:xylulokinase
MLLGLDLGTTNVKALVTDRSGRQLAKAACPVRLFRLSDGGVEQDIEEIWQATLKAMFQAAGAVDASQIRSIGVSSQGGAMQVLDPQWRPLGRVISWLDQRGLPFDDTITAELGRDWFLQRIVHGGSWLSIGQVLRLRAQQPGLVDPPNRIGFVGDTIVSRLCGSAVHDGTSAGLTLFYNPKLRTYDPDLLQRLGLRPDQLPALLPPQTPAGGLLPEVARATGLRPGVPVSAAAHDQYASALATGAVKAGTIMVGTGTAWVLLAVSDRLPRPMSDHTFVCHHVVEALWGQILSMVNGGSAVSWALEIMGIAAKDGDGIDAVLQSCPPGSEGVTFWPFMTPFGAAGLAAGTRGHFAGLQLSHRGSHFIRAVVEGLAYELNRHLDLMRDAGQQVAQLVMGGGAAASRVTPQLVADVTGLPLRTFARSEASLLGAAILARGLLEPGTSLSELSGAMLPDARQVEPGDHAQFYGDQYHRYRESLPLQERDASGGGQSGAQPRRRREPGKVRDSDIALPEGGCRQARRGGARGK